MSPKFSRPTGLRGLAWRAKAAFMALSGVALPPWDDYWYSQPGHDASSGMNVSPETAMRLSAVFACVRVKSETLGSSPLVIFRQKPNGDRERATKHPLYSVFHDRPNQWQTPLEFIEMMQAHLDLRGNAFAIIVPGPRGAIDQLIPQHPDLVQVYRLPNGRLKYQVRSRFTAEINWYTQDEMHHLRGLSSDGLVGMSPIAYQRDVVGNGLAMDDELGKFFRNGARPSGVLQYPGKFKDDAARRDFAESWRKAHTGDNSQKIAVLENGMEYKGVAVTYHDAQFLDLKKMSREEIAGIYRVPPHKIGILERATNNNIEHQGIEFVTDCMRPAAARWEHRINMDLVEPLEVGEPGEYFAEFILDGSMRGPMKERYDAYYIGRQGGWLCPNDVCRFENMNSIPEDKGGNDYLRPVNYVVAGAPDPAGQNAIPAGDPAPDAPDDPGSEGAEPPKETPPTPTPESIALLHGLAADAARRVVRKEVAVLRKILSRSSSAQYFTAEADKFYETHASLVAATLCITKAAAAKYVAENRALLANVELNADKSCVIDWIEDTAPDSLADLSVGRRSSGEKASSK